MAEAVESALADKKHLIVEAGTGTGKTLAYLVPAILSGKRVVISTGTKNLQEQLFFKDIPFLEKHLGPLRACYMKGRAQLRLPPENLRRRKRAGARRPGRSRRFSDHSRVGEDHRNRRPRRDQDASRIEQPRGPRSTRAASCAPARSARSSSAASSRVMHQRAQESDIIIVNHHLFFADLAVKGGGDAAASFPTTTP